MFTSNYVQKGNEPKLNPDALKEKPWSETVATQQDNGKMPVKNRHVNQVLQFTLVIPVLKGLRKEDCQKIQANLGQN